MESINVKVIHPTNNADIDIGLPGEIILRDVFTQLIDASFLAASPEGYRGVNKSKGNKALDNDKSMTENGVENNDTILVTPNIKA